MVQILGHRGASASAPENTLTAFREAVAQGADGVELDVQLSSDGEVVVCHDDTLERLAGESWPVVHTPYRKLKTADVGTRLGFAPDTIPTLDEVLAALPRELLINVELKCGSFNDHGLTRRTVEVLRAHRAEERVIVSSFNAMVLWRLAEMAPELRCGYLIDPDRGFVLHGRLLAPMVSTYSIHPHHSQCTPRRVAAWRAAGYRLAVWTVDDAEVARRMRDLGVDYLITNRPALLRAELGS